MPCSPPTQLGWKQSSRLPGPHLTPQWAAVTTQSSLMREPPQKWKPVLSWQEEGEGQQLPPGGTPSLAPTQGTPCLAEAPHLQGHLPGPAARDGVLPIDDPGQAAEHGGDGRDPTAWGQEWAEAWVPLTQVSVFQPPLTTLFQSLGPRLAPTSPPLRSLPWLSSRSTRISGYN